MRKQAFIEAKAKLKRVPFFILDTSIFWELSLSKDTHMHTREEKSCSETFKKVLLKCQDTVINICQLSNLCGQ